MRRFVAIVVVVTCSVVASPASAKPPSGQELAAVAELFDQINAHRAARGSLVEDAYIDGRAYRHSKNMARTGALSHRGFKKRVTLIRENDPDMQTLCENVAYVSGSYTPQEAAGRIFNGWRNSPGHNQCMLRDEANTAGIGIKKSGRTWWATFLAADDATP